MQSAGKGAEGDAEGDAAFPRRPPNPRATANPLSALTFTWLLGTFWRGAKRDLEAEELPQALREHQSDRLGELLERLWGEELARGRRRPSLARAMARAFGLRLALYGLLLAVMEIALRVSQPLFLGRLVLSFGDGALEDAAPRDAAMLFAGLVVACSALNVLVIHPYMMAIFHMGMKMRVAACALIYRKALRLSKTALGETTAAQAVNLLANDVARFDLAVIFIHYLWIGPLETMLATYVMYEEIGVAALIGVATILMFIPLQAYLGRKTSTLRLRTALRTDERVRLMNEFICGAQVIKMFAWEHPFHRLVQTARRSELKALKQTSYIRGVVLSFIMFNTRISIFVSILAFVLQGGVVTAERVFVITAYYNILRQTMTVFFPQGLTQLAEAFVSIARIQKFLEYGETPCASEPTKAEVESPEVALEGATTKWIPEMPEYTLHNVSLHIRPGQLVAVVGHVGAGKTSLLHALLGELPLAKGSVRVRGRVAYAAQEPWLFAGSVRQNVLFGQPMDRHRYSQVLKVCALKADMKQLPYSDKTIVGERGVSLSGGQRARINLARAVYREADVYLLDDPLSAVDTHVGKHLFDECITGYLSGKIVVLITHQLQYLKDVHKIYVMENGEIRHEGTFAELQAAGLDFSQLESDSSDLEESQESRTGSRPGTPLNNSRSSVGSLDDQLVKAPQEEAEGRSRGTVAGEVYLRYLKAGGNWCVIASMLFLCVAAQGAASGADYWITYWTNIEEVRTNRSEPVTSSNAALETPSRSSAQDSVASVREEDVTLNSSVGGNSTRGISNNLWTEEYLLPRDICIYVYAGIVGSVVILALVRSFVFFKVCIRASQRLHDSMFYCITHAKMHFFNTNPSGRVLNRFSKDMGAVDEILPQCAVDTLQIGLALLGVVAVLAVVNPWLLLPTAAVGTLFYLMRRFYLSTSRSVKRLEGITRSPVFSHLNASLQGLTTIRAFGAEKILIKEFDNHQDLHSSAWYIFIATSRAFGFWLDIICVAYIAIVTFSFLTWGNEMFGGNVGLAITQAITLTGMFQWGMRQSAEMENQMTSVERILEYNSVEQEPPLESQPNKKPPGEWPMKGCINFRRVSLKYNPKDAPVLKNLTFTIEPGEKVGIVGRTGAGKSSLISALFRLADVEGSILLDNIDTGTIGLHDLRKKISIIPQEPVLFTGTLRKNLDPFDEFSDAALLTALEEVELKETVRDLPAGLGSKVAESGSNFSAGQRQLLCLARAILRDNKVLVLDEATANVDPQTDALIQTTIRKKFAECTVLTIAHRLHTVMDSDRVLVMDAGCIAEFGHPHDLLQNAEGHLRRMVENAGRSMAEQLMRIAASAPRRALPRA